MIVKTELIECPICQFQYTIGYSDCLALFNKKRPNYLAYMLSQEIIFYLCIVGFCSAGFFLTLWQYMNKSVFVHSLWLVIIATQTLSVLLLGTVLLFLRIKAKYSYREIEDIVVYDRMQKQALDYDSPAILMVYFEELRKYEDQPYYYKKDVPDLKKKENYSISKIALQYRRPNSNPL